MVMAVPEEDVEGRLTKLEEADESGNPSDDVFYVERYCSCGSVRRMRGRRYHLFGDAGLITSWDAVHADLPHMPVSEEQALATRADLSAMAEAEVTPQEAAESEAVSKAPEVTAPAEDEEGE